MKFWWFLHTIWPSSLETCSSRSVLQSIFFLASNQCNMASSSVSSLRDVAQLVIGISTRTCPAVTQTSFSVLWLKSTMAESSPSALWVAPKVTPSRMDCMSSGPRLVVIWLSISATVLSHLFWYSNWKLNFARAPTHWWPVVSKLRVGTIYVKGLLSVLTKKVWYSKYSLKCSVMDHVSTRNSNLVEW